jgi:hypothetical protein
VLHLLLITLLLLLVAVQSCHKTITYGCHCRDKPWSCSM